MAIKILWAEMRLVCYGSTRVTVHAGTVKNSGCRSAMAGRASPSPAWSTGTPMAIKILWAEMRLVCYGSTLVTAPVGIAQNSGCRSAMAGRASPSPAWPTGTPMAIKILWARMPPVCCGSTLATAPVGIAQNNGCRSAMVGKKLR